MACFRSINVITAQEGSAHLAVLSVKTAARASSYTVPRVQTWAFIPAANQAVTQRVFSRASVRREESGRNLSGWCCPKSVPGSGQGFGWENRPKDIADGINKMVGAVRFELTTSCTPSKRAYQATLRPDRITPGGRRARVQCKCVAREFNIFPRPSCLSMNRISSR